MTKTTIEQSRRLIKAGCNPETADLYYLGEKRFNGNDYELDGNVIILLRNDPGENEHFKYMMEHFGIALEEDDEMYFLPSWSLSALWDMIHKDFREFVCKTELNSSELIDELVRFICETNIPEDKRNKDLPHAREND